MMSVVRKMACEWTPIGVLRLLTWNWSTSTSEMTNFALTWFLLHKTMSADLPATDVRSRRNLSRRKVLWICFSVSDISPWRLLGTTVPSSIWRVLTGELKNNIYILFKGQFSNYRAYGKIKKTFWQTNITKFIN